MNEFHKSQKAWDKAIERVKMQKEKDLANKKKLADERKNRRKSDAK